MNSDKLKLFDLLKADDVAGTIHLQHRRMLLMDADAMGLLRKELIDTDRGRHLGSARVEVIAGGPALSLGGNKREVQLQEAYPAEAKEGITNAANQQREVRQEAPLYPA